MFRQQDMAFADALEFLQAQLTLAFSTEDIQEGVQGVLREARPGLDRPVSRASRSCAAARRTAPRTARAARSRSARRSARLGAAAGGRRARARRAGAGLGGGPARRARRCSRPAARSAALDAGERAGAARGGLHDRARDAAGARAARAGRARRLARRARRLQHARDDRLGLPRRDVPRGGVRALGQRASARASTRAAWCCATRATSTPPSARSSTARASRRWRAGRGRGRGARRARLPPPRPRRARPVRDGGGVPGAGRPDARPSCARCSRELAAAAEIVGVEVTAFDDRSPSGSPGRSPTRFVQWSRSSWRAARRDVASPPGGENEFRHGHRHGRIRVGRRSGTPGGRARRGFGRPAAPRVRLPRRAARPARP